MSYLDNIISIWELVKESFKDTFAQGVIDLWIGKLKIVSFENNCITFSSDYTTVYNVVKEKHLSSIKKRFSDMLGYDIDVDIILVDPEEDVVDYSEMLGVKENTEPSAPASSPELNQN